MASYLQLRQRIATELSRGDLDEGGELNDLLKTHVSRACEHYADTKFWFNSLVTTATTSAGTETVAVPATIRIVERVTVPAYDRELREVTLVELDDGDEQALPDTYAYYNDNLKLYPVPDASYTLNVYGVYQIAAPSADADTNVWTTEAQDLIVGRVKFTLCRGVFRDAEGATLAAAETTEALARLQRETARRLETPLRPARRIERFNINTG